jgi:Big-like domain-containing protein
VRYLGRIAGMASVVALVVAAPAGASFRPVGGNLNVDPANGARMSGIAAVAGVPYVALSDQVGGNGGPLRVRRLNGTSWDFVGGDVSTAPRDDPRLTSFNNQPWVTSTEFSQANMADHVFVSFFNGTTWERSSSALNIDSTKTADSPDITTVKAGVTSMPYVAFSQFNGTSFEARVRRRKGNSSASTWEVPGDALQGSAGWSAVYPQIVSDPSDGTPYISWVAQSPPAPNPGGSEPPPPLFRLYVARGTMVTSPSASYWTVIGGQLNQNEDSVSVPDVAVVGGEPWAVWTEQVGGVRRVRVARYSGGGWQQVGQSSVNVDPAKDVNRVRIANVGGTAYVVLDQQFGTSLFQDHVWVKRFDGTNWVSVGGPLNLDPAVAANATGIADAGGVPYVAFDQSGASAADKSQLRVSRLEAPTCQAAAVDVPHNALGFTISLSCDEGVRALKSSVAHGVLSDLDGAAGTVKYTPAANSSGADSFTFASSDGAAESAPATVSLNVAAPTGGGSGGGGGDNPTVRPSLSALRRTHGVFAVGLARTPLHGRAAARRRKPTPRGTTFSFQLNQAATVTMAIRRVRGGRRVGRRCLAPTPARARRPRCLRLVTVATLTRDARAGSNSIPFSGRLGKLVLSPGSYRAVFSAANATGRSAGRTSGFTIVR